MMAQTMPTMAPAQRVVAPELVEQNAGVHRQRAAEPTERGGEKVGKTIRAKLLVEVGGLLSRHFEARDVEKERDGHDAAEGADLGARLGDHAPIDRLTEDRIDGEPKPELAKARQEPYVAHGDSLEAEQHHIHRDEEAEERDRERKVARHKAAKDRDRHCKQRP